MTAAAEAVARPQDRVITRPVKRRVDWGKWGLAFYFLLFILFLYAPMILMAILSFQNGLTGSITFPFQGPISFDWWRSLWDNTVGGAFTHAGDIRSAAETSLELGLAAGAIVAVMAYSLSMAFRRRFRGDGLAFYLIMLALMTPGFLLGLGTQLFWKAINQPTDLWHTALGANTVWGIPFGFLVMLAVWNRYDVHIEEAARDLGAGAIRTFKEVTLPLVWTGLFGCFLFGFTLTWNDYDRTVLIAGQATTLPMEIAALTLTAAIRPDLYALGTATTAFSLLLIAVLLIVIAVRSRLQAGKRVQKTEEELGLVGGIDAEAAEAVATESP